MKLVKFLMVCLLIAGAVALFLARGAWIDNIEQHSRVNAEAAAPAATAGAIEEVDEPEEIVAETSDFYRRLSNEEISRIKLVGDNITAGAGLDGYTTENGRVIFDAYGELHREANTDTSAWSNSFRTYVSNPAFGEIDFINAGIVNKTAAWTLQYLPQLLGPEEDVVVLMIGTDDRIIGSIDEFENTMRQLTAAVEERANEVILMAPPPSTQELYEYQFTMEEANEVLRTIALENDYVFISHYEAIEQALAEQNLPYEQLMNTGNANPTEAGHEIMWQAVQDGLGLQ